MDDNMLIYIVIIIFVIAIIRIIPIKWFVPRRKTIEYFTGLDIKNSRVKDGKWLSEKMLGLNYKNKGRELLSHLVFNDLETKSMNIYNTDDS